MTQSHTGQFGTVNGHSYINTWNIQRTRALQTSKNSSGRGGTHRKCGVGSWQGGWNADGGAPTVFPGQQFAFAGYSAPDDDVEGSAGIVYSGQAVCNQLVITIDKSTDAIVSHAVSFLGHLGLTEASGAAALDAGTSMVECSTPTKIEYGSTPVALADWTTATLTITANVASYVNSETAGETGRKKTSDIDWTMAINVERTDSPLAEGSQLEELKVYVNATEFWHLNYARVQEYGGFTVDRSSNAILAQTLTLAMDAKKASDGSLGSILAPDTTQVWPPT